MAVLVNMSSSFEKMDSHTAHRLFSLLDLLSRRYSKGNENINHSSLKNNSEYTDDDHNQIENDKLNHHQNHESKLSDHDINSISTRKQSSNLYSIFLQMIFEILNICLYFGLPKNPHFIYALLYSKDMIRKFSVDPNFSQCVVNLQVAIDFFETRLSSIDFNISDYSSNTVLDVITAGSLDWKNIYFKYQVNDQKYELQPSFNSSEFFIPQTWMTILSSLPMWPHPVTFPLFSAYHPVRLSRTLRIQLQKMHETVTTKTKAVDTPIVDI